MSLKFESECVQTQQNSLLITLAMLAVPRKNGRRTIHHPLCYAALLVHKLICIQSLPSLIYLSPSPSKSHISFTLLLTISTPNPSLRRYLFISVDTYLFETLYTLPYSPTLYKLFLSLLLKSAAHITEKPSNDRILVPNPFFNFPTLHIHAMTENA